MKLTQKCMQMSLLLDKLKTLSLPQWPTSESRFSLLRKVTSENEIAGRQANWTPESAKKKKKSCMRY